MGTSGYEAICIISSVSISAPYLHALAPSEINRMTPNVGIPQKKNELRMSGEQRTKKIDMSRQLFIHKEMVADGLKTVLASVCIFYGGHSKNTNSNADGEIIMLIYLNKIIIDYTN